MSPFDFLNAINYSKAKIFEGEESERDYVPFVINRTLSYSPEAVMLANEMNKQDIPKDWQFAFLLGVVPKKKRYVKWEKKVAVSDDVALVQEAYKYSAQKAEQALACLTPEQLETIRQTLNKGGKSCKM